MTSATVCAMRTLDCHANNPIAWPHANASGDRPARGISSDGAIVVVRPDQYVAHVLPLAARHDLAEFFANVLSQPRAAARH
jgi:phenol 2-monooxygenase